jgi:hypothetical protein
MGCSDSKSSRELCLNLFKQENFPELRSMSYKQFNEILCNQSVKQKGLFIKTYNLSYDQWKYIVKEVIIKNRVDEFSEIQLNFLIKIYNVAQSMNQGKHVKDYILLLLFPFFNHEAEKIEENSMDNTEKDYNNNNNNTSTVLNKERVVKEYFELLKRLGDNILTFQNANFFLVYYFANIIRGVSFLIMECFYDSRYYDFVEVNNNKLTELNFKKFFYSVFNEFYEEINYRYLNNEIVNMYNYNLTEDDITNLFQTKLYLFTFEGVQTSFWNYMDYIKDS